MESTIYVAMVRPEVKDRFKELKVNYLAHTRGKNATITERDIKIFLLLIHYPNLSAKTISKYYKQIDTERSSFKTGDLVRTALSNLKAKGFVKSSIDENDRRIVRWTINEEIITQLFLTYDRGNPEHTKPTKIDMSLLKEGIKLIQLCSYNKDEVALNNKILKTIKSIESREDPTQIHSHIVTMIEYIMGYIDKQIRASKDKNNLDRTMDFLIQSATNVGDGVLEELKQFKAYLDSSIDRGVDTYDSVDDNCPLFLKNLPDDNLVVLLFKLRELHRQLSNYVKEHDFISKMISKM